jgi:hypothetical protein
VPLGKCSNDASREGARRIDLYQYRPNRGGLTRLASARIPNRPAHQPADTFQGGQATLQRAATN